jgi:hypothetical protein
MIGFGRIGAFLGASTLAIVLSAASCGGGSGKGGTAGGTGSAGAGSGTAGATGTAGAGTGTAGAGSGTAGSTGAAGGAAAGAVQSCKSFAKAICTRANDCRMLNKTAQDIATCTMAQDIVINCDGATSAGYATCLKDFNLLSCDSLFPASGLMLPGSCTTPLNTTPLSAAQMKCDDLGRAFCAREFECAKVALPTQDETEACAADYFSDDILGCSLVTAVSSNYNSCVASVAKLDCPNPDGGAPADAGATTADGSAAPGPCTNVFTWFGD